MAYLHLLLGLSGLLFGSDLAVRGAISAATRWGWPSWVTGILLLALGTSLPELFVCITSAPAYPGLAAGNIFGSNAFNVGVVLGVALLWKGRSHLDVHAIRPLTLLPLLLGSLLVFFVPNLLLQHYPFSVFLIAAYAWMVFLSIGGREKPTEAVEIPAQHWSLPLALLAVMGGFALLAIASEWFLNGALELADQLGWKEGFAGFLITAVGTSAPELFTSLRALKLGHAGAVFGNVVGSNAFNLLLAGGAVGLLAGVPITEESLQAQLVVNLLATLVLLVPALLWQKRPPLSSRHTHLLGWVLIVGYGCAAWWIF